MSNLDVAKSAVRPPLSTTNAAPYSPAVKEYLRAIYALSCSQSTGIPGERPITTSALAARLAVRPASVTAMLQKMVAADPPLVVYHKNRGASLTAEGERAALGVVRCHRLLELFLHEKLGYSWDEVHDEADQLEHVISPLLTDRLDKTLGHPTHDPHGHAIPAADLSLDHRTTMPLNALLPGQSAVVAHVADDDPRLLVAVDRAGLRPGRVATVIAAGPDGVLRLRVAGNPETSISRTMAAQVYMAAKPETTNEPTADLTT